MTDDREISKTRRCISTVGCISESNHGFKHSAKSFTFRCPFYASAWLLRWNSQAFGLIWGKITRHLHRRNFLHNANSIALFALFQFSSFLSSLPNSMSTLTSLSLLLHFIYILLTLKKRGRSEWRAHLLTIFSLWCKLAPCGATWLFYHFENSYLDQLTFNGHCSNTDQKFYW